MRCDLNDECSICDVNYNYVLDTAKKTCVQHMIDNCQLAKEKDQCMQCKTKYKLNQTNFTCETIEDVISNCLQYDKDKCLQCSHNFYPKDDLCLPVTNTIKDCAIYASEGKC